MSGKTQLLSFLFILCINIESVSNICIPGDNCPYYQGVCKMDVCECSTGYQTFIRKEDTKTIYCNYEQTSWWLPFILELFLPSAGLFYLGRFFHAFLKLALFLPVAWKRSDISAFWFSIFFLMYFIDLLFLFLCVYSDGNGIALI